MKTIDFVQFILFVILLIAIAPLLGRYMAKVFDGQKTWLHKPFGWLEKLTYKFSGVDAKEEMSWKSYAAAFMIFHICGIIILMILQMTQAWLPLNPQNLPNISWHSALNTAVSFITNTNWQGYSGEVTMSYFTQMVSLTVQNFLSAACGMAVAIAFIAERSRAAAPQDPSGSPRREVWG